MGYRLKPEENRGKFASEEIQRSIKKTMDGYVWHTGNIRMMKLGRLDEQYCTMLQFLTLDDTSCGYFGGQY